MSESDDLLDPGINSNNPGYGVMPRSIPNANAILVLGIISIVGCALYGIPGLVCGIIALSMFKKVKDTYLTDKQAYEVSFKNANAGYVCAIIGTILSGIYFLILVIAIIGAATGNFRSF
jgi:hypothetical protein